MKMQAESALNGPTEEESQNGEEKLNMFRIVDRSLELQQSEKSDLSYNFNIKRIFSDENGQETVLRFSNEDIHLTSTEAKRAKRNYSNFFNYLCGYVLLETVFLTASTSSKYDDGKKVQAAVIPIQNWLSAFYNHTGMASFFEKKGREICKAYNEATDIDAKKKCDKYFQIVEDTKYVPTFSRVSEIANISLRISVFDFHRQNENAETKISPHNLKIWIKTQTTQKAVGFGPPQNNTLFRQDGYGYKTTLPAFCNMLRSEEYKTAHELALTKYESARQYREKLEKRLPRVVSLEVDSLETAGGDETSTTSATTSSSPPTAGDKRKVEAHPGKKTRASKKAKKRPPTPQTSNTADNDNNGADNSEQGGVAPNNELRYYKDQEEERAAYEFAQGLVHLTNAQPNAGQLNQALLRPPGQDSE